MEHWVGDETCLALASVCSRCKGLFNLFLPGSLTDKNLLPLTPRQLADEGLRAGKIGSAQDSIKRGCLAGFTAGSR